MKTHDTTYTQMGMASLLPGMRRLLELMKAEVSALEEQLAAMQNGEPLTKGEKISATWTEERRAAMGEIVRERNAKRKLSPSQLKQMRRAAAHARSVRLEQLALAKMDTAKRTSPHRDGPNSSAKRYQNSPERIGDDLTLRGLAKMLGLSEFGARTVLRRYGIKLRKVGNPGGSVIGVITPAVAQRVVDKYLKGAATPPPLKQPAKAIQPNHPKNPGHPKHDEWLEKMRRVTKESAQKRMAAKREASAA